MSTERYRRVALQRRRAARRSRSSSLEEVQADEAVASHEALLRDLSEERLVELAARPPAYAAAQPVRQGALRDLQRRHGNTRVARLLVQRQAVGAPAQARAAALGVIVDDTVAEPMPGQMRRGEFLEQLQAGVAGTVEAVLTNPLALALARPEIARRLAAYRDLDAGALEAVIRRQVSASAGARTARGLIGLVCARVQQAISESLPGSASGGAAGLAERAMSGMAGLLFKAEGGGPRDGGAPAGRRLGMGAGHALEAGARGEMGTALGIDLSDVHVHTDSEANDLAQSLNARAFTVGRDVVFGAGQYAPGTPVGDALIAHELAHVAQQRDAQDGQVDFDAAAETSLEEDADQAAVGLAAGRLNARGINLAGLGSLAVARLRTGLRLQRCFIVGKSDEEKYRDVKANLGRAETVFDLAGRVLPDGNAREKAEQVAGRLGQVNGLLERVDQGIAVYGAVEALQELNRSDPSTDPEGFAKAAGKAMASLGGLLSMAPPPLNAYGDFLSEAGDFFDNMRYALDPALRYRNREDWREAMGGMGR